MELKSALEQLGLLQKKLYAYQTASSSLYLDSVTVAPKDTSEGRGVALGILAGESQKLITAPETGELLAFLADQKENLSFVEQRQVEELKRSYDRLSRIPADEYMDYAMLTNEASDVWHRAKESSDFTLFAPVLEKLVAYNRKFAGYYDSSKKPYDALLDEYERGADMAFLDTFFDAASLAFDIVSFCIEPTPMGAVDILTDVVGLVTPGVPSAGLKVGVHAAETAYDAYKAVDTVHDLSKAADVAITVSKKGDAVLDAADAAKDIRNADYLQDSLNRIVKAQHPNPKKGFSNTYALTTSKDGRLVLSKNRGVPGPKARQEAENIFGKGKVEFAGGKNANLDLDLLKSKGISTKGIDFGRLHHAEPRAVQYMLKNNIPTDNAVQVVSRKSCDSCSNLQYNLGWKRRR